MPEKIDINYKNKLKCPKCGSDCYIWYEGDITNAILGEVDKEFLIYCINDCGIVDTIKGKIILDTFQKERSRNKIIKKNDGIKGDIKET